MSIIAEVCLYLLIVLGIICATIAAVGDIRKQKNEYVRYKSKDSSVLVEIKCVGLNEQEIQDLSCALASGEFSNIYDLIDEFKVFKKDE